ncbi:MAG: YhgE/Pip domain-containing protein, partial [Bacillota bacterium]|nr:YhgE/Pip domain-containing protein [Bacillota bacterium]
MRLKGLKGDLKALAKNKFMIATIIAITLIPVIYGGLYLAAFWAPYDHTENIKVAVVNLDKGYINDDNELKEYGKEVEISLSHNDDLGWYFEPDYDLAIEGLNNDKYYSLYVIPEDFSKKLEGIKKGDLRKPVLQFIPNEKKNYINSLINKKGFDSLQAEINAKISSIFASIIIENLELMKDGLNTGTEALFLLTEGTNQLKNKIPVLESGIDKINDGTNLLSDKLSEASDGVRKINDASESLNSKMPELVNGVNDLNEGTLLLSNKLTEANEGVDLLKDTISSYQEKLPKIQDATNDLYIASSKLADSTENLKDKGGDLEEALDTLSDAMETLDVGIGAASSSSLDIVNIADSIYNERKILSDTANDLIKSNLGLKSSLDLPSEDEIESIITVLSTNGQAALASNLMSDFKTFSEMGKLIYETNQLLDDANNVKIDITDSQGKEKASGEISEILKIKIPEKLGVLGLKKATLFNPENGTAIEHFDSASDFFATVDEDDIVNQMDGVSYALSIMKSTMPQNVEEQTAQMKYVENELVKYGDVLSKKLEAQALFDANLALSRGLGDGSDGTEKIKDGIEKVNESTEKFVSMIDLLYKNNNYMTSSLDILNTKIPDLEQGISVVNDNVIVLDNGMRKLANASMKLSEGTEELNGKIPDLQEGTAMLADGSRLVVNGVVKLENASIKLFEGTKLLNEKMPDLLDGVNKINDTTVLLGRKMESGADRVSDVVIMNSQNMGNFMAEPIKAETNEVYAVENYGAGFTPYFVSLALWVGALALFIVVPIKNNYGVSSQQFAVYRYLMFSIVGIIQALILTEVILKLGLKPSSVMTFGVFNIFLSLTFIAIVQSLIYIFGDVGKLIATVWFVLQLTACGGTFSKELTPQFFQSISPYMPFTYSVSGIREIISGMNQMVFKQDVVVLLIFQIIALSILFIGSKYKNYNGE